MYDISEFPNLTPAELNAYKVVIMTPDMADVFFGIENGKPTRNTNILWQRMFFLEQQDTRLSDVYHCDYFQNVLPKIPAKFTWFMQEEDIRWTKDIMRYGEKRAGIKKTIADIDRFMEKNKVERADINRTIIEEHVSVFNLGKDMSAKTNWRTLLNRHRRSVYGYGLRRRGCRGGSKKKDRRKR